MARNKKSKKVKKTVDEKIGEVLDITAPPKNPTPAEVGLCGLGKVKAEPVEGEVIDAAIVVAPTQPLALGYAVPGENPEIDEDYRKAREILDETGKQALEALEQMKEVAEQDQQARPYEVVGQLIKANLEVVKAKTDLHRDMKALRENEGKIRAHQAHIGDVHNSVFVGTTDELMKLKKAGKLPQQDESK